MALRPRGPLLGATSSVLRYNFFPILLVAIFNKIFGIPLIGRFGDSSALGPNRVGRRTLRAPEKLRRTVDVKLKTTKTDRGQKISSLLPRGDFPPPTNNMLLSTTPPVEKANTWATIIHHVLPTGSISYAELETVIDRLATDQTSVFGGIGRGGEGPAGCKTSDRSIPRTTL